MSLINMITVSEISSVLGTAGGREEEADKQEVFSLQEHIISVKR